MFGPRSPRYPMLTAYLATRPAPPVLPIGSPRAQTLSLASVSAVSGLAVLSTGFHLFVGAALLAAGGLLSFVGLRTRPPAPPTPEQELARRADAVVRQIQSQNAKLHRVLHPAIGSVLEECAGYVARIALALDAHGWDEAGPQWTALRNEARIAAKVAMDEALVHAGATLAYVPPARPLEHVSDALEDIGFGPLMRDGRSQEPMPPAFRPVRDLAERLRELAGRCETMAFQRREEAQEPISMAFRRLDATLGEMRSIEEAENELRHGA